MSAQPVQLAIETSSRRGSVSVGRGDRLLESVQLAPQQRHAVELLPRIDELARRHNFTPADIGEIHISIGPGSFTGLRIGVTTAKMLARVTGAKLIPVPTLDVVAANAPLDLPGAPLAVMLNAKSGRCFTGIYDHRDDAWQPRGVAQLMTPAQLVQAVQPPFAVLGDHLPDYDWPADVRLLDAALAVPRSEIVWQIGRTLAQHNNFTDPYHLQPLYVRLPDAEEKRLHQTLSHHPGLLTADCKPQTVNRKP